MDKNKINKPQQQKLISQDNASNQSTHNLGITFPLAKQYQMINHQNTYPFSLLTIDLSPSYSSSSDSNTINIKETNQINYRKRTQKPLYYLTHYRHRKYTSQFNTYAINNNSTEYENKKKNPHHYHYINHDIINNHNLPYLLTIYVPNTTQHNTQIFETHQKSSIIQLTQNS